MKLKFENVSLGFIGDIHGNFQELQYRIKPFRDTVFIVAGDCGFGFYNTKEEHIKKMLKSTWNQFLEKRNLTLLFIRGNHDLCTMFTDELFSDRFRLLRDYSIVTVNDTNILCVGGAVSVDRRFRKTNKDYWLGEEMLHPNDIPSFESVDIICAHTASRNWITHLLPPMPDWLKISFDVDKKLIVDTERENEVCDILITELKPKYWIHGHYHVSGRSNYEGTEIISLNCYELYEFRKDVSNIS